jgi:integrase
MGSVPEHRGQCAGTEVKGDAQDSADFLEFLGLAGLGQAEASSLARGDIDFEKGCIITFRHKTKTGFAIPLYPQLRPLLARLCRDLKPTDKVFKVGDRRKPHPAGAGDSVYQALASDHYDDSSSHAQSKGGSTSR